MSHRCFIALGSNLDTPLQQIRQACKALQQLGTVIARSPLYHSKAVGPGRQPDYINAVALLETRLAAPALLKALQQIESNQGRTRETRWAARTLDLDILLYDDDVIDLPELIVPHPRITERNFVIYPLYDIAPQLTLPGGQQVAELRARLPADGLALCTAARENSD